MNMKNHNYVRATRIQPFAGSQKQGRFKEASFFPMAQTMMGLHLQEQESTFSFLSSLFFFFGALIHGVALICFLLL